ncbi:hypothetical protein [Nocardia sp. BMG111209]|uniref:hypothetical protein n=1 Tax=Nocardia sp. BMG111209 TaxID=1160137 RepID=UPI0003608042|nr:hypothetical protein [Nocardia sp. BMG111209]
MPHDSAPTPEPVPLTLGMPAAPAPPRGLIDGLVRRQTAAAPLPPVAPAPSAAGPVSSPAGPGDEVDRSPAPVLDLDLPDEEVAGFLAGIAHADTGFVARTRSGDRALAVVAGTAAALCGMDIRAALAAPDLEFLRGLRPAAVAAVREVLLAVETAEPDAVTRGLAPLTATPPEVATPR